MFASVLLLMLVLLLLMMITRIPVCLISKCQTLWKWMMSTTMTGLLAGWLMLMLFEIVVYLKDLEVFATKTETNNEQQQQAAAVPVVAANTPTAAAGANSVLTAPTTTATTVPKATTDGFSVPPHHDAALVAQNTEQSLASTKEKSTPEKVSILTSDMVLHWPKMNVSVML